MKKNIRQIFFGFLLILFFGNIFFKIVYYQREFTTRFNPEYWKMRYYESQWVVSDSKNPIGDDGLYAYAGWNYITGGNPVLLNAQIPPLGKYIIGVGEITFQNQNILMLIIGLSCLGLLYIINTHLFKDKLLAFIPVFLFSFDSLFYSQLRAPYLDTMYLFFLLLTLLFMIKRNYVLSSFFLGCFASLKYPVGSLFLAAPIIVWVVLYDRKHMKQFILSLVLWPAVFVSTYCMYFIKGGDALGFAKVQKYIVAFYSDGVKATPGIVYPMILFGKWYTWFAGVQKVVEWTFLWAISFIGALFAILPITKHDYLYLRKSEKLEDTQNQNMTLILLWVLFYLAFLTFTPVFPRYLLLLLPFMYNLTVWFLVKYVLRRFS